MQISKTVFAVPGRTNYDEIWLRDIEFFDFVKSDSRLCAERKLLNFMISKALRKGEFSFFTKNQEK